MASSRTPARPRMTGWAPGSSPPVRTRQTRPKISVGKQSTLTRLPNAGARSNSQACARNSVVLVSMISPIGSLIVIDEVAGRRVQQSASGGLASRVQGAGARSRSYRSEAFGGLLFGEAGLDAVAGE